MGAMASCVSNILYLGEKISLCASCTALVCCLVITITMTLGMGIGLGYNYCYVVLKTRYKYVEGHYIYPGSPRWPYGRQIRSGNAPEEPESEDDKEVNSLRWPQSKIKGVPPSISPDDVDPDLLRELDFNNTLTDDEGIIHYDPTLPDSESYNGTEITTLNFLVDDDDITNVPGTSFTNSSSTTPSNNSSGKKAKKLVIPITGLDLISILSKLSTENKNYSLQVVTT